MIVKDILIEALCETHSNTFALPCNSLITCSIDYFAVSYAFSSQITCILKYIYTFIILGECVCFHFSRKYSFIISQPNYPYTCAHI